MNEHFAGREAAIRWCNQLLWLGADKSYMYDETIFVGKEDTLFEACYLAHSLGLASSQSDAPLVELAADLEQVSLRLAQYRVRLVILFTPSKSETFPDLLPSFLQQRRSPPRDRSDRIRLKSLLQQRGLSVVDGAEITRALPAGFHPTFPRTGTHWTNLAASATANALLVAIAADGQRPSAQIRLEDRHTANIPRAPDADLLRVLNLASPEFGTYHYAKMVRDSATPARQGRVVEIGGSFLHNINAIWEEAELWQEIDHFFYFTRSRISYPGGRSQPVQRKRIDWTATLGSADAVILEINESNIFTSGYAPLFARTIRDWLPPGPSTVSWRFPADRWCPRETDGTVSWRWAQSNAAPVILCGAVDRTVRFCGELRAHRSTGTARILSPDGDVIWAGTINPVDPVQVATRPFAVCNNLATLRIETDIVATQPDSNDSRYLSFALTHESFEELP